MTTQPHLNYLFINEHDLSDHLSNPDPVIKINLYGEKLEESPYKPLYIKVLDRSRFKMTQIENVIRAIIKVHASYALAFHFECLNFLNIQDGVLKKDFFLSLNF